MRTVVVVLLAAALGVSSAFLVACGDRNALIPRPDAEAMKSDLDRAKANFERQECRDAQADVRQAKRRAESLPAEVDRQLKEELDANLDHVLERIQVECGRTQTTQTTTATTPTTAAPTTATTPTTAPDPPPTTEPEPEPPPTTDEPAPTPEPGGDGGSGGGGSGGGSGSGGTRPGEGDD